MKNPVFVVLVIGSRKTGESSNALTVECCDEYTRMMMAVLGELQAE